MIAEGRTVLRSATYLSIIPGIALVIAVLAVGAVGGVFALPVAVLAHEGGTLLVVGNSLRLLAMGGASGGSRAVPAPDVAHGALSATA